MMSSTAPAGPVRNYEDEIKSKGVSILFACTDYGRAKNRRVELVESTTRDR